MSMNAIAAANAYRNQMKMLQEAKEPGTDEASAGSSFANLLENVASNAVDTQYQTDSVKMKALVGDKVDLTDLVTAVASAELSLNTVIAVRDRVINAYQDIIRMPI